MNRRLPPLTALRAFEAAARHLSFTAAAVELNVTQGAISRQIRGLEARLGVALFDRFNRRVALTQAGATLLPSLTHALDLMAAGVDQVAPRPAGRPPLRVSCLGTLAMRWLIPRLQRFKDRHPGIEVALTTSDGPLDPSGVGIDIALRVGAAPWPGGQAVTPLFDEVVGPVGSRAVLDGVAGDPTAAIRRLPRLHTATRPTAWRDWAAAAGADGFDGREGPVFEHFYFLLEAAIAGLGVAVVPRILVEDDLAAGRLVAPLGFVPSGLTYYLAMPHAPSDRRAALFRDWTAAEAWGTPARGALRAGDPGTYSSNHQLSST